MASDQGGGLVIAQVVDVDEMIEGRLRALPLGRPIGLRVDGEREGFEALAVMGFEHAGHQKADCVVPQIGRQVTQSQPAPGRCATRHLRVHGAKGVVEWGVIRLRNLQQIGGADVGVGQQRQRVGVAGTGAPVAQRLSQYLGQTFPVGGLEHEVQQLHGDGQIVGCQRMGLQQRHQRRRVAAGLGQGGRLGQQHAGRLRRQALRHLDAFERQVGASKLQQHAAELQPAVQVVRLQGHDFFIAGQRVRQALRLLQRAAQQQPGAGPGAQVDGALEAGDGVAQAVEFQQGMAAVEPGVGVPRGQRQRPIVAGQRLEVLTQSVLHIAQVVPDVGVLGCQRERLTEVVDGLLGLPQSGKHRAEQAQDLGLPRVQRQRPLQRRQGLGRAVADHVHHAQQLPGMGVVWLLLEHLLAQGGGLIRLAAVEQAHGAIKQGRHAAGGGRWRGVSLLLGHGGAAVWV